MCRKLLLCNLFTALAVKTTQQRLRSPDWCPRTCFNPPHQSQSAADDKDCVHTHTHARRSINGIKVLRPRFMCDNHLISRKARNVWNVLLTPQTGKFHFSFGTTPHKTTVAKVWMTLAASAGKNTDGLGILEDCRV